MILALQLTPRWVHFIVIWWCVFCLVMATGLLFLHEHSRKK